MPFTLPNLWRFLPLCLALLLAGLWLWDPDAIAYGPLVDRDPEGRWDETVAAMLWTLVALLIAQSLCFTPFFLARQVSLGPLFTALAAAGLATALTLLWQVWSLHKIGLAQVQEWAFWNGRWPWRAYVIALAVIVVSNFYLWLWLTRRVVRTVASFSIIRWLLLILSGYMALSLMAYALFRTAPWTGYLIYSSWPVLDGRLSKAWISALASVFYIWQAYLIGCKCFPSVVLARLWLHLSGILGVVLTVFQGHLWVHALVGDESITEFYLHFLKHPLRSFAMAATAPDASIFANLITLSIWTFPYQFLVLCFGGLLVKRTRE